MALQSFGLTPYMFVLGSYKLVLVIKTGRTVTTLIFNLMRTIVNNNGRIGWLN